MTQQPIEPTRGIGFSDPMVLALLRRRKSQTRRVWSKVHPLTKLEPGQGLYVKEMLRRKVHPVSGEALAHYSADGTPALGADLLPMAWFPEWKTSFSVCPPMYMPLRYSRLLLRIKSVEVQQLDEITEADALAEGFEPAGRVSAKAAFAATWDQLHAADTHKWAANPKVLVLKFSVYDYCGADVGVAHA